MEDRSGQKNGIQKVFKIFNKPADKNNNILTNETTNPMFHIYLINGSF